MLYVADTALPVAVSAVSRLREAGLPVHFLTNTTRMHEVRRDIARIKTLQRERELGVGAA